MRFVELLGRLFFAAIFLLSAPKDFTQENINYNYAVNAGVPVANILVPLAGILALLGGLSIALGLYARIGAALVILFLVPVTLMMHNFWAYSDPQMHQMQQINFMKNLSMLGGSMAFAYFGAGPISIDAWITNHLPHDTVDHTPVMPAH